MRRDNIQSLLPYIGFDVNIMQIEFREIYVERDSSILAILNIHI
jgi:hypothetical protein